MLLPVQLLSDIHMPISGHQSTTNIQPITEGINGTESSILLGIVNGGHVHKYTFRETRPDFNNHPIL